MDFKHSRTSIKEVFAKPAGVGALWIDPSFDEAAIELLEERDRLEQEIVGWILADPPLSKVFIDASPKGLALIGRDDLRIILAVCSMYPHSKLNVLRLAWRGLEQAGFADDSIQHFRRGLMWSPASLAGYAQEYGRGFSGIVKHMTGQLVDIAQRLDDCRHALAYARARLEGAA